MPSELDELRELLEQLGEQTEAIPFSQLYPLSDLAGEKLAEFRAVWDTYPALQHRRLMQALVALAEASFEVNFDAIFRLGLDDPDPEVRAAAIDGLWENEEVRLVGPMLNMLRTDPAAQVRAAAATGLGRFVLAGELEQIEQPIQERIMSELLSTIHLADESVEVRRRAIESAAYAGTPEILDALEVAYYDDDELMRISSVVGMGRSCDRRWRDNILTELQSSLPAMRYEAALASGELRLQEAVPILARLIDDPDNQVRDAAIWALGQTGGPQAKQVLLAAYDEGDESTRAAVDDALAEQALVEGELDFTLYEVSGDLEDELLDDELYTLWSADDEDDDDSDLTDWELDGR